MIEQALERSPSDWVELYLEDCRGRGLSPLSVEQSYAYPLRALLLPFCEAQGITDLRQLDQDVLSRLTAAINGRRGKTGKPLSRFSVRSYLGSINLFLRWAANRDLMALKTAKKPKKPNGRLLDVLSKQEIDRLAGAARNERDELIVRVLAETGVRVGELLSLTLEDLVDFDRQHFLRVKGKTGERLVAVVDDGLWKELHRYVEKRRPKGASSPNLFLALKSRDGEVAPLTRSGVEQLLRSLGKAAGIKKRVYPHLLRHSWITWALNAGVPMTSVARNVGHTSLAMIHEVYNQQTPQDVYKILKAIKKEGR